ncbi:MAG: hypothetical protein ACYTE2_09790, partial [Planctomycetota bacterium]
QQASPPPAVDPADAIGDAQDAASLPEGELGQAGQQTGEDAGEGSSREGGAAGVSSPTRLSREQASRLLQLIRDKEQQRRAARAAELARERRRTPVRQDW